jgi:AraC-like DNA-binding protein
MIRRSDPEAFRLVMAPQCRLRHDPHAQLLNLQGRDLALYDTSREFESWRRPGLQTSWLVVITVPRVLIDVPAQRVGSLMGKALPRGLYLHPIAGRLLTAIGTRPGSFESLCPQTVGQTLAGLVEGLIADGLGLPVPTDVADRARVLLAQAAIVEHAHDPEFTAAGIARQLHESGRTLRDSARRCNTRLQRLLTEHRVQQAIRDIADPTHLDDNLKTIAARCGFSSHEVLTRTIRAYRDCTPSSLRPARTNTDQPPRP